MDGKGLDPFNHHFLPAGTKPPLTGWKRTSIFLPGFIQCQKAFTASARVLGMQRQHPGQAGRQPAPQTAAPPAGTLPQRGDSPRCPLSPLPGKGRKPLQQARGLGAKKGFPKPWFNPAGKFHGSALAGARDGGGACSLCVPPAAAVGAFEPNLRGFGQEEGKAGSCIPTLGTQLSIPPAKHRMHPAWKDSTASQLMGMGVPGAGGRQGSPAPPGIPHPHIPSLINRALTAVA